MIWLSLNVLNEYAVFISFYIKKYSYIGFHLTT